MWTFSNDHQLPYKFDVSATINIFAQILTEWMTDHKTTVFDEVYTYVNCIQQPLTYPFLILLPSLQEARSDPLLEMLATFGSQINENFFLRIKGKPFPLILRKNFHLKFQKGHATMSPEQRAPLVHVRMYLGPQYYIWNPTMQKCWLCPCTVGT